MQGSQPTAPRTLRRTLWGGLLPVAAAYLVVGALVLLPMFPRLFTHAVGDRLNDVWPSIWHLWWVSENLGSILRLDTWTDMLFYPTGVHLHTHIPIFLGDFLALPLLWIAGPIAGWNLAVYLAFCGNCMAMYALARHFVADRIASFVAGLLFGVNAFVLGMAYNGSADHVILFFIPLTILAVARLVERPGGARAVVASLALLLATLTNWYYGFYLCVFTALYVVIAILRASGPDRRRLLMASGLTGLLYAVAVLPVLIPLLSNTILARAPDVVALSQGHFTKDVTEFFTPGRPTLEPHQRYLMSPVYIGWVCLVLAGLALWRPPRDRTGLLAGLALVFFLLTLGARLSILGHVFPSVPMPSRWLPVLSTFRAQAPLMALLALLGAYGVRRLLSSLHGQPARLAVVVLVPAALLAEVLLLAPTPYPIPTTDMRPPAVYRELAEDPTPYGIIEVPFDPYDHLFCGRYMFYQSIHGKPLAAATSYFPPFEEGAANWDYIRDNPVLAQLLLRAPAEGGSREGSDPAALGRAFKKLKEDGFRVILVHTRSMDGIRKAVVRRLLSRHLAPPERKDDGIEVWHL